MNGTLSSAVDTRDLTNQPEDYSDVLKGALPNSRTIQLSIVHKTLSVRCSHKAEAYGKYVIIINWFGFSLRFFFESLDWWGFDPSINIVFIHSFEQPVSNMPKTLNEWHRRFSLSKPKTTSQSIHQNIFVFIFYEIYFIFLRKIITTQLMLWIIYRWTLIFPKKNSSFISTRSPTSNSNSNHPTNEESTTATLKSFHIPWYLFHSINHLNPNKDEQIIKYLLFW